MSKESLRQLNESLTKHFKENAWAKAGGDRPATGDAAGNLPQFVMAVGEIR